MNHERHCSKKLKKGACNFLTVHAHMIGREKVEELQWGTAQEILHVNCKHG